MSNAILKQERPTPKPIAFDIEVHDHSSEVNPEVKKRLESSSAAQGPQITLEQISAKLKKAEEKRKKNLSTSSGSPIDERRQRVVERKASLTYEKTEKLKSEI